VKLPLRAVQIGAGSFCEQFHAPTLKRLSQPEEARISLEAICDLDQQRARLFAKQFGYARTYSDLHRMIEQTRPDVVYVMVEPTATAGIVEQLLPLGIPVFTEKPPGVTVAQAERLAELAEQYKTLNYVAFNRRAMPAVRLLRQWINDNGPARYVRAEMLRNRRLEPEFGFATAIHPLDGLRFLCGSVRSIETCCNKYVNSAARDFYVRLCFESGLIADLTLLVDCGTTRERYLAHTANQMMEVTLSHPYSSSSHAPGVKTYKNESISEEAAAETDPLVAGGFLGEHNLFLDAVESGLMPSCCLQDARHSLRLAMAVHEEYSGGMDQFAGRTR
jgi:predicted dehydrogenase